MEELARMTNSARGFDDFLFSHSLISSLTVIPMVRAMYTFAQYTQYRHASKVTIKRTNFPKTDVR